MIPRAVRPSQGRTASRRAPSALLALFLWGAGGLLAAPAAAEPVRVIAFNDLHGRLRPPADSTLGGVAWLATHVASLRRERPSLLVSAGDLIGASELLSAGFHDEPTLAVMQEIGLDAMGVGNHEFDRPFPELQRLLSGGCHVQDGCFPASTWPGVGFPLLGANVRDAGSGAPALGVALERSVGAARVAVVGLTYEGTPGSVLPENVASLRFADELDTLRAVVPGLRAAGADVVVVMLHATGSAGGGASDCMAPSGPVFEIAAGLGGLADVIVAGHSHDSFVCRVGSTLVTSAGAYGQLLTVIDLDVDPQAHRPSAVSARQLPVTRDVAPDPAVAALLSTYESAIASEESRVVGRVAEDIPAAGELGNSPLGFVVADAMQEATPGTDCAFHNQGGVRASLAFARAPGEAEDGLVRYGELFAVLPFSNRLLTLTLSGAEILAVLEQEFDAADPTYLYPSAGCHVTWQPGAPPGARLGADAVTIAGAPLDPGASYRVTTNSFLAAGGSGFSVFRQGRDRVVGGLELAALEAYLAAHSPLRRPSLGRITTR